MSDSKAEYNWGDLGVEPMESFASGICEEFPRLQQHREQVEQLQRRQAKEHSQILVSNLFKNMKISCEKPTFHRRCRLQSRKDQLIRECEEQERKQREFHSRPMPDFRQAHSRQSSKVVVHRITCPTTPNVLKNSREMEKKRRLRVEQLQRERELECQRHKMQAPRAKPIPQSSRQPLKSSNRPSAVPSAKVKVEPFNLSAESRVQQRRIFNIQTSKAQEARRRELEDQRQRAEREAYQKLRQRTTFRARPNPFSQTAR
ncbi:GM18351 [Drosophila sechellia]|uniref:GM18351 n=1 Tax=Drosophila sechellia TaxID=7238 RepID=B4I2M8_DROSE|nr:GM18351 [Drosophila sechellia]